MFRNASLVTLVGIALASCAAPDPALVAAAARPISCSAGADCDAKWSRAVAWVVQHGAFDIRIQTEELIETEGPVVASPDSAFTITRLAISPGTYAIQFASHCANMFGCVPSALQLKASFVSYVLQS